MSKNTKVDIIVEVLGEKDPGIQRLVALDDKLRTFAEKSKRGTMGKAEGALMNVELVAEWAMLQDRYYQLALEKKQLMS